jgi:DNA topoisomerase-2
MADRRKDWLRDFVPGTFVDHRAARIALRDFVNRELILFSMADNVRSIPSVVDGLKPGHRKILYACFKRNLTKAEIKVAQLAGYVAEHSAYHHGEQSLCATIVGLAQSFLGSNNVPLLQPNGQFGTRLQGGKDAASPRYIFTLLSPLARLIFRPEDDALLAYLTEDGQGIEPEWYMPILPMVLVNGTEGIGTGWSTFIPNYNPMDIVANLRRLLSGEPPQRMHPWYAGFTGDILPLSDGDDTKYTVRGRYSRPRPDVLEITELPVGVWTQPYKEFLESLMSDSHESVVKDFSEYHTDTRVHFKVTLTKGEWTEEELEKRFKLTTTLTLNNVVTFDRHGRIRKWRLPGDILQDFHELRLQFYHKRKEHLVQQLRREWTLLDNRMRFIQHVIDGMVIVNRRPRRDIIAQLKHLNFHNALHDASNDHDDNDQEKLQDNDIITDDGHEDAKGFDYLLSMPIYSLTAERIHKLGCERDDKQRALQDLLQKTPQQLWLRDLDDFEHAWAEQLAKVSSGGNVPKGAHNKKTVKEAMDEDDGDDDVEYVPKQTKRPRTNAAAKNKSTTSSISSLTSASTASVASSRQTSLNFANVPENNAVKSASGGKKGASTKAPVSASKEKEEGLVNQEKEKDQVVDVMELPLAERIARMLASSRQPH